MIQAEHITKTFHGFKALDDMSLHVPKGTIYGLVGPNGAGKSTLIRHLTGIYRPDCGSILIDGLPVYDNPEAKAKFTYIPDDLFYFLQADTLEMKRFYQGIYQKFDTALFDRLQEFSRLSTPDATSADSPKVCRNRSLSGCLSVPCRN